MQELFKSPETLILTESAETASRRAFLTRVAALGAGLAAVQLSARAQTAAPETPMMPGTGTTPPGTAPMPMAAPGTPGMKPPAMPKNELQYRVAIAPVGRLSLETSRIAALKAVDPAVRQFANFELAEQIALNSVLMDMKTPMPPMSPEDQAILDRARNTPAGPEFDRDFTTTQMNSHIYLRDTAINYLGTPPGRTNMMERHGRHLATMNVPAHNEHIAHTQEIMARMTTTA